MDSSRKGFSPSRRIPNPSFSGESDENEFIPNEMVPNCKPRNRKSKVVVVKRVLGERSESLASCDMANVPPKPRRDGRFSACSYTSKSDDDEDVLSTFSWDASMKPYDPKTNYESPRPKYLRYKPNRRHEQSLSLISQNQGFVEGEMGSESDQEPPQECSSESSGVKEDDHVAQFTDNEEEAEEEEEDEEFEEEKGGCLKWIVKFLVLLAAVMVSTSYISTMNDPTPSPVVEAVGVLRDGFNHMHRYLSVAVFPNVNSNIAWVNGSSGLQTSDVQTAFLERNNEMIPIAEPIEDGMMEDGSGWSDFEIDEEKEADVDEEADHFPEFEFDLEDNQESVSMDVVVQIPSGTIDDCEISLSENDRHSSDKDVVEETDHFPELKISDSDLANDQESVSMEVVVQNSSVAIDDCEISPLEKDHLSSDKDGESFGDEKPQEKAEMKPVESEEAADILIMESNEQVETDTPSVDSELTTEGGFNPVLYLLSTAIVASLACIYYLVRAKQQAHAPDSSLHEVSDRKEERPLVEFHHKPEKTAILEGTSEVQRAETQAAPIVELLAEMDIQEHSSSLKSYGTKVETVPVLQVPFVNASNSGDSSSHGSLAAEKSILRKQARRGKVEKPVPTPVRRSSRIRNLSVASP